MKKEIQVVMLPTEKASVNCLSKRIEKVYKEDIIGELTLVDNPYFIEAFNEGKEFATDGLKMQYLYFLSDEEIKEGDWKYNEKLNCITQHLREGKGLPDRAKVAAEWCKKIIATNDESLFLPYAKTQCPKCSGKMIVNLPDHIKCENCGQEGWNLMQGVYDELQPLPGSSKEFLQKYCELGGIDKVLVEYQFVDYTVIRKFPIGFKTNYKLKVAPDNTISTYLVEN